MQARAEEDEFRRAQERLTLKHRNTSRWARRALKRGLSLANDSEREALQEQLRLSRELRAKAARARDGSESDGRCAPSPARRGCLHWRGYQWLPHSFLWTAAFHSGSMTPMISCWTTACRGITSPIL